MISQTSLIAFKQINKDLARRQQAIYDALRIYGNKTNAELAQFLGWPIKCVTPRVLELRNKSLVSMEKMRVCSITGRLAKSWHANAEVF